MFAVKTLSVALLSWGLALSASAADEGTDKTQTKVATASMLTKVEPQKLQPPDQDAETESAEPIEVLVSRYPSGAIQIERQVRRNDQQVAINHGLWKSWTAQGQLIADGSFEEGKPHGRWHRVYRGPEANHLLTRGQEDFELPLHSTVQFVAGELHGEWKIVDAQGRKVRCWNFSHGKLHGEVATWFPSGGRMRDAHYDQGMPSGRHREFTSEGKLTEMNEFKFGRLLSAHQSRTKEGNLEAVGTYLMPRYRLNTEVLWWDGEVKMSVSDPRGTRERAGLWTYYHPNGKRAHQGEFVRNVPDGKHAWWYPNGQLKASGSYQAGQPHGAWTWGQENGLQQRSGTYQKGQLAAKVAGNPQAKLGLIEDAPQNSKKISPVTPPKSHVPPPQDPAPIGSELPLTADASTHKYHRVQPATQLR